MLQVKAGRRGLPSAVAIVMAACAALAGTRSVAIDFTASRQRLVQSEVRLAAGETLSRTVPATNEPLSVVIAEARGSDTGSTLEVRANGALATRKDLGARRARIDVQVAQALLPGSAIELACRSGNCAITYLELANLHGFSSGLFNALFLPASRHDYRSCPPWLMAVVFILLAFAWTPPTSGRHPRTETAVAGLGVLVLTLALLSPFLSRYALVLALPTFLLCLVLVFGASVRRRYLVVRARFAGMHATAARWLDGGLVALAILGFYVALVSHGLEVNKGNYTGFLYITDAYSHAPVLDDYPEVRASLKLYPSGYDGQFMFLMAFDPLLAKYEPARYEQVVDAPGYRYGRIGFSALTRLFSAARPALFAPTMVWLTVVAQLFAAAFLAAIAIQRGATPWQVLPYVLIPGFLVSVGSALPEPLTAALLLGGVLAYQRGRTWVAVVAWAASLLVRETGAILVLIVIASGLFEKHGVRRSLQLLTTFVPLILWRVYVAIRLFPAFGWTALWKGADDVSWPFAGFFELWSVNDLAHGHGQPFNTWFPVVLIALFLLSIIVLYVRRNAIAAAAAAYGLLAVSFNYRKIWVWAGNGERITFELFVLVLVATLPFATLPRYLRWALAAFAVALFAYDFRVATYATWFRSGLVVFH